MNLIIFDLDGTLIDSRLDIATSVNDVLARMNRPTLPSETIYGFIGDGVRCLLERSLGDVSTDELEHALEMFLPTYREHLLDTTRPYPGARDALEALRGGRTLAVLSNKPTRESIAVLQGLDLLSYFDFVYGGESFLKRKPHPMGVEALLEKSQATVERTLLVGDSRVDYETARNASISVCLVTYGIGAAEVARLEPDYLIDDLRQLIPIVTAQS